MKMKSETDLYLSWSELSERFFYHIFHQHKLIKNMSLNKVLLFSASGLASFTATAQNPWVCFHALFFRILSYFFICCLSIFLLLSLSHAFFTILSILHAPLSPSPRLPPLSHSSHYPVYCKANGYCHVPGLPDSCTSDSDCRTPWYQSSYCQTGGTCHLEPPPKCKVDSDCKPNPTT